MLLYNGPATPPDQITPEMAKGLMDAFGAWAEKVGNALVDFGNPMTPGMATAVIGDGTQGKPLQLNGYSIVEAEDLDSAVKLTGGHPFLSTGTADFSVEVFELLPVPGM
jgi:hypothetical protein